MKTYTKVHELLASPDRWCTGCLAQDGYGREIGWCEEHARRWCLYGAILKVYFNTLFYGSVWDSTDSELRTLGYRSIGEFNDTNDHATVLAFCKRHDI